MARSVDALIIGAGPTGLTLGLGLLRQGKSVVIAEKHMQGLTFSRAILVNGDTLKALQVYGASEKLHAIGIPVNGFTLHVNGRAISQARYVVDEQDVTHPICLPQLQTESVLADCFVKAGGEILRGYAFTEHSTGKLERSKTTVLQPYQHEADPIEVHSDWLFGCDGFHSTVRSSLGIEYPGDSLTVRPYAVDLDLSHWPFETNVNVFLEPQGGCLAVQIGENQVRLVTTTDAQREAFLRSLPVEKITWDSRFDVHFHVAQSSGLEHTWLAGDAVHVHSPVGGRGMNMGMMDSIVLAESIASGDLEHYAKQRHAVASDWVRFNRRISTIALDSTASSLRARRIITSVLPVLAKIMGPRLANTAFSRLSDSNLRMQKSPS